MPNINFRRRLMNGASNLVAGAFFDFSNFNFRTVVPTTQTRSFLETHVYTGSPKLSLKANGLLGFNRHNEVAWSDKPYVTSSWLYTAVTCTGADIEAELAPDGVSRASIIRGTTATSNHMAYQNSSTSNSGGWISCYVKQPAGSTASTVALTIGSPGVRFNLETQALTQTGGFTNLFANNVGNGWWFVGGFLPGSWSGASMQVMILVDRSGSTSYAGLTTDTLAFWRFHVNQGSTLFATPETSSVGRLDEPTIFSSAGVRQGILLEPAATNSAIRSQEATGWTFGANCAVTGNDRTAPDETITANRFAATSASGFHHQAAGTNGLSNGSSQETGTASIYVRGDGTTGATRTRAYIVVGNNASGMGSNSYFAIFDIPLDGSGDSSPSGTGVIGAGTYTSARSDHVGDGWYRIQVQGINGEATTIPLPYVGLTNRASAINTASFVGTEFIHMWGMQYERLATAATSYIPTTTAAVTRTADTCYRVLGPERLSGSGTAGTLVAKAIPYLITGTAQVADLDIGNSAGRVEVSINTSTLRADISGQTAHLSLGTPVVGSSATWGIAYATNDAAACANGGTVQTDASVTLAQSYLFLRLGTATYGGEEFLGVISRVRFWPSRITNAELQSATTDAAVSGTSLDLDYATGIYQITPVNAGVTTTYDLASLISSGLMTLTGTPSAKWVRGPSGTLVNVAAGSLALEYDATGALLGCINTEPQRTNIDLQSRSLQVGVGISSVTRATTSSVSTPGAFGGNSTWALIEDTTPTNTHQANVSNYTQSAGTTTHWGIFKAYGRSIFRIQLANSGFGFTATGEFTLSGSGSASFISGTGSCAIEALGTGWYYCSVTTTSFVGGGSVTYLLCQSAGVTSYTGDGVSGILVDHRQTELGSYRSSAIITTASTVTRNADVWTLNLGSWFDNSRYVVASKVFAPRANMTDGSNTPAIWALNLATPASTNYIAEWLSTTNRIDFLERTASVDRTSGNATTLAFPAVVRSAFGWSPRNARAALNGSTITLTGTPSDASQQQSWATLRFGDSERTNTDQGSVYIQNIQILPLVPTQANVNQYAGSV